MHCGGLLLGKSALTQQKAKITSTVLSKKLASFVKKLYITGQFNLPRLKACVPAILSYDNNRISHALWFGPRGSRGSHRVTGSGDAKSRALLPDRFL